jgi:hypothetical protein
MDHTRRDCVLVEHLVSVPLPVYNRASANEGGQRPRILDAASDATLVPFLGRKRHRKKQRKLLKLQRKRAVSSIGRAADS